MRFALGNITFENYAFCSSAFEEADRAIILTFGGLWWWAFSHGTERVVGLCLNRNWYRERSFQNNSYTRSGVSYESGHKLSIRSPASCTLLTGVVRHPP